MSAIKRSQNSRSTSRSTKEKANLSSDEKVQKLEDSTAKVLAAAAAQSLSGHATALGAKTKIALFNDDAKEGRKQECRLETAMPR
jgi:hypothetical protein